MNLCLGNAICGLDFNPLGTLAASNDHSGVTLISDINTNAYISHLKMYTQTSNFSNQFFSLL